MKRRRTVYCMYVFEEVVLLLQESKLMYKIRFFYAVTSSSSTELLPLCFAHHQRSDMIRNVQSSDL